MACVIVADTSWVAALRDPHDAHHGAAIAISDEIGDEPVLVAAVTLAECLVPAAQLGALEEADVALRAAFDIDPVDDAAPARWAWTRATSGLRLPDAIVLDTAIHHQARGVATFDARLAKQCRAAGLVVLGTP
jgi:predicted nucleic acid-binding protein